MTRNICPRPALIQSMQRRQQMRHLVLGIAAATAVLTAVPAFAQVDIRAGDRGVSVGIGDRDRDWHERRVIRRHGVFARDDCRTVTVRRHLPDGSVVTRKTRRCD
jgi:hypothetical protein